jgi:hypothetical protein
MYFMAKKLLAVSKKYHVCLEDLLRMRVKRRNEKPLPYFKVLQTVL